jgi:hypothetical protein
LVTPSARACGVVRAHLNLGAAAQITLQLAGQQFNPIPQQDFARLLWIGFRHIGPLEQSRFAQI